MIRKQKDGIREEYRELRRQMPVEEKFRRDSQLCDIAVGLVSFRYAESVLMYAPTPDEIDVNPIAEAALAKGKRVFFPKCNTEDHTMNYHEVKSLDELKSDAYGLLEPPESNPMYIPSPAGTAVCLIPGLVFDIHGFRVGYGKGFYDRYLSDFAGCKIGVVYSDCILNELPRGRFDLSVDVLLTENGVRVPKPLK